MHTFLMVVGGVGFTLTALLLIFVGARVLPRVATMAALAGLGLGYVVDGPWCAAFGAFVGLFFTGWAAALVLGRRARGATAGKNPEPAWVDLYFPAVKPRALSAPKPLLLPPPAP